MHKKRKTMKSRNKSINRLERLSTRVASAVGTSAAFITAVLVVVAWLITGPIFHYSDTWQLFINTGTTIVTFLMVFLIQRSQNKDSLALNLKLNELVAANTFASNRLVSVEDLTEEELLVLRKFYSHISQLTKKDKSMNMSHSIEEAGFISEYKDANARIRNKPQQHK